MNSLNLAAALLTLVVGCGDPQGASGQPSGEIVKATREVVRANNLAASCRRSAPGDLPAAEKKLAECRSTLAALQAKALESFAKDEQANPKNPAVFKARARLRWTWLGASIDQLDEEDRRVRRERTEDVNKALQDLDRAIALDPNDGESLMLRGRLVLLEGVELYFFALSPIYWSYPKDTAAERLREFGIDAVKGEGLPLSSLEGSASIPGACDRAIADFSRAIAVRANDAQLYYWRSMAFWYKVLYIVLDPFVTRGSADSVAMKKAAADDLEQAKKNIDQARFLMPQDELIKRLSTEQAGFFDRIPTAAVPRQVNLIPPPSAELVFKTASPAVVRITVQLQEGTGFGSGSIMNQKGLILTNKHVIDGARSIAVALKDGRQFKASLVAEHDTYDLALIRLNGDVGTLPVLSFSSAAPGVGEDMVIIGHPKGMSWSLTSGKVSQIRNSEREPGKQIYVQTDAAVNPGNSGGPLLNLRGQILGVVTMKFANAEGMAFAIHKNVAGPFVSRYE
ncbi:MAG TPA: trypsin-like peptidase domain-containing protein [Planctomycetota bacterium]